MTPGEQDLTGRTLGHYAAFEKIGSGGMGVVYRAVDTRLDRPVAIKILRADTDSAEQHRRFVQEAKTASALNHPNIVTIYEIGAIQGVSFIAMEYLTGRTLEQAIGGKSLPVEEALGYAVQIADALAAAHGAGIIHRDVKPGNIMISDRGLVKVLDFGLAKLAHHAAVAGAPTVTLQSDALTTAGAIVGTLAYMSPEQAEGKKIDHRSDIFAFGAVLYEMVTGHRAFGGPSAVSVLMAIAGKEPPSVHETVKDAPAGLEEAITRCLRKEPEQRFQQMEDVKAALEELRQESMISRVSAVRRLRRPARRWSARSIWLAAGGLGLACILAGGLWLWEPSTPRAEWRPILTRLTADKGMTAYPTLSPDGKLLAYASDRAGDGNLDIWVQQVGGGNPIRVTSDKADEYEPAFSPDGSQIAFRSDSHGGSVCVVATFGGLVRTIADRGRRPLFSPDGKQIVYWVGSGTGTTYLTDPMGERSRQFQPDFDSVRYPVWSPDGKWILFLGTKDTRALDTTAIGESQDWWIAPAAGGRAVRTGALEIFRRNGMSAPYGERLISPDAWTAEGDAIFSARLGGTTNVWRIAISPRSHQVTGAPQRLTLGTQYETQARYVALTDGGARMVYTSLARAVDIWSLPVDTVRAKVTGPLERVTQEAGQALAPSLSRDGKKMVYLSTRSGNADVYLKDFGTGKETAVTMTPSDKSEPSISPDGTRVAYVDLVRPKVAGIFAASITQDDHISSPDKLCEKCAGLMSWSSDSRYFLFGLYPPARAAILEPGAGKQVEVLRHPKYNIWQRTFSPDDRWIGFNMVVSPFRSNLYVARLADPPAPIPVDRWIAVTDGENWDDKPRWSPDGDKLYFISQRDGYRCIWLERLDPATKHPLGEPSPLYHLHGNRLSMLNLEVPAIEMGLAADKLVFALGELTGNIWMAQAPQR